MAEAYRLAFPLIPVASFGTGSMDKLSLIVEENHHTRTAGKNRYDPVNADLKFAHMFQDM